MVHFKMRLANKVLDVTCFDIYTKEYCQDFLVDDSVKEDYSFVISKEDIQEERDLSCNQGMYGSIELSALYRKIVTSLSLDDILLFHSSSFEVNGKAYCIAAHSGVGKSTHVRLLRETYGKEKISYINGDKPLLLFKKDSIEVFGTPWNGKEREGRNVSYPLNGIAILSRGKENSIKEMNKSEAYSKLIEQIFLPKEKENMLKVLSLFDRLIKETPIYDLRANMEKDAAITSFEGMIERK